MVKLPELPLISSDYPLFSWDVDEQHQKAYTALTSQGHTSAFSRLVWNDIIDKLVGALTEAGLTWDNSYGTVDETKMTTSPSALSAKRFNAVTYNIEQVINTTWRWEVDADTQGYLGRSRVYGYTNKGLESDYVYGWYLVELARVLNVFLNILKNEANFGELIYQDSIRTFDDTVLTVPPLPTFSFKDSIVSSGDVVLKPTQSFPLVIETVSKTNEDSVLLPQLPWKLQSKSFGKSYESGELLNRLPSIFEVNITDNSNQSADMLLRIPSFFRSEISSFSEQVTKLNMGVAGLLYSTKNKSKTSLDAKLVKPLAGRMSHSYISKSLLDGMALARRGQPIGSTFISETSYDVNAVAIKPKYANYEGISTTNNNVEVLVGRPRLAEISIIDNTKNSVNLVIPKVVKHEVVFNSQTSDDLALVGRVARKLTTALQSKTSTFASITFKESDWLLPIQKGTNLYIRQVYSAEQSNTDLHIDASGQWLEPIQTGTNLYIRQAESLEGSEL